MVDNTTNTTRSSVGSGAVSDQPRYGFALVSLTALFFMWGFITCLNDILVPHLKNVFSLNYTQSMLIQFCFFGAYFLMSIPAGAVVKRVSYKGGIVLGLLVCAIGCILFVPAASFISYPFFLLALFILATGVTLLQVSANPYVTILGAEKTAASRLTLTQAFNSLGTTVAPAFGSLLILSAAAAATSGVVDAAAEADRVKVPYMILAAVFLIMSAIFALLKLPKVEDDAADVKAAEHDSAWRHPVLVLGAVGLFLYVGAEVSIGSFLVNFISLPDIGSMDQATAANYVAYYWGGAMIGRFVGAFAMRYVDSGKALAFNAAVAIILVLLTFFGTGHFAMWTILAVGLFNSIMFPTIFSLALKGLGPLTSQGAGVLCLAIVGGAILPVIQGALADSFGIQHAFLMPIICYVFIAYYGLKGHRLDEVKSATA